MPTTRAVAGEPSRTSRSARRRLGRSARNVKLGPSKIGPIAQVSPPSAGPSRGTVRQDVGHARPLRRSRRHPARPRRHARCAAATTSSRSPASARSRPATARTSRSCSCPAGARSTVAENARLFAQKSYIFEAGSCLVLDGEELWLTGDYQPQPGASIHEQIEASGAPKLLLETYAGRLEYHDPWHRGREVSHLFRGLVDAREVDDAARARGPRRAAARRQRRRAPPLARARRARRRPRLPPRPARGLEGQRRRAPHARSR